MPRKKVEFPNQEGILLAGALELPKEEPQAYALFAHCFTCGKDVAAASRICRGLAKLGVAVLRFDFTGLGNSDGDFANTNFSSNMQDLLSAANFLRDNYEAPSIVIGHSLGGAAVLNVAQSIPELRGVVTIAAPSTATHVKHLFSKSEKQILSKGIARVDLAGREFTIKKQFLEDLDRYQKRDAIAQMECPLLIFHSPQDDTVDIQEAARIYRRANHPKSFISLDDADHLLTHPADAEYVAMMIVPWVARYLEI